MQINLPEVHAQVSAVFALYEDALVNNRVDLLDQLFWDSPHTLRYGMGENLHGIEQIRAFRAARSSAGLSRTLQHSVITTFGRDFATANTEFLRPGFMQSGAPQCIGRQSQTWCRVADQAHGGWRVVAAHVSLLTLPLPLPSH